jgi:hypothetical protein
MIAVNDMVQPRLLNWMKKIGLGIAVTPPNPD